MAEAKTDSTQKGILSWVERMGNSLPPDRHFNAGLGVVVVFRRYG